MRCKTVRRRLSAFADGELPQQEIEWIKDHLACCPHCQREADELSQVYQLLTVWMPVPVSNAFAFNKPVTPLPQQNSVRRVWQSVRWAAAAACAVGLLMGGVLGIASRSKATQKPSVLLQQYVRLRGMDALGDLPPESIEGVYVTLVVSGRR
jgi:anti-sigma factor RsiW